MEFVPHQIDKGDIKMDQKNFGLAPRTCRKDRRKFPFNCLALLLLFGAKQTSLSIFECWICEIWRKLRHTESAENTENTSANSVRFGHVLRCTEVIFGNVFGVCSVLQFAFGGCLAPNRWPLVLVARLLCKKINYSLIINKEYFAFICSVYVRCLRGAIRRIRCCEKMI